MLHSLDIGLHMLTQGQYVEARTGLEPVLRTTGGHPLRRKRVNHSATLPVILL